MTVSHRLGPRLDVRALGPEVGGGEPLGTAWLARSGRGIDLATHGYEETEWLIAGEADTWSWDEGLRARATGRRPFITRVLVRRPAAPERFSGLVQLEPHHPDDDRALTWAAIGPWIVREGHAHVGVTQEPAVVADLAGWDPDRYGTLALPDESMRWDIVGQVARAMRDGSLPPFAGLPVARTVLSGWSMTGTFCRTFLGEGFHERCATAAGPAIDGYVICISSGGAGRAGYGSLAPGRTLALDDPRRVVSGHGAPAIELLSESEFETHHAVLRPDSDAPDDRYRLYGIAGTGHINGGTPELTTNRVQRRERGAPHPPREIVETPTDARMDLVARAVFAAMDRWIARDEPPPRADRFDFADAGPRGHMTESRPLRRDADGNAVGGVRTPWVSVPLAGYLPHSTPAPGRCLPAEHAPYSDPALLADLIAHMRPFDEAQLRRRYGDSERYLAAFTAAAERSRDAGWLLAEDLPELIADRTGACGRW